MTEQGVTQRNPDAPTYSVGGPDRIDHTPVAQPFSSNNVVRQQWARGPSMPEARAEAPAPAPQSVSAYGGDPLAASFTAFARSAGMPDSLLSETESWWSDAPAMQHDGFANQDALHRQEVQTELQRVWGPRYSENLAKVQQYLASASVPDGVADVLHDARLKDGRALLNDAPTLVRLFGMAERAGPPLPKVSGDIDAQIRSIEARMKKDRASYNRDEALQLRYRALLAAKHG